MKPRQQLALLLGLVMTILSVPAAAWEDFLTLAEAPKAVFPEATDFERKDIKSTEEFRRLMKEHIGRAQPTIWEPYYITFTARRDGKVLGYAVVCEEIGKHRPITFITAVTPDGKIKDVAVMMYREAYGGEVRYPGFTRQFKGKSLEDPIAARKDIRNISGATLSSRAMARGVRKALAVLQVAYLEPQEAGQ